MMRNFKDLDSHAAETGTEIGVSKWVEITQAIINKFAEATGDKQWIHTDPERCQKELGHGTIAHGYYTLSLIPILVIDIYKLESITQAINCGSNKLRFHQMIPVNSHIRLRSFLKDARRIDGGMIMTRLETIEIEGSEKPALTVETISLYYED